MLPFFIASVVIVILHLLFHPVRVLGMSTSIFYMDEKYTLASFMTAITAFLAGFFYLGFEKKGVGKITKLSNIGIGIFLIVLSLDEFFEVHEYANTLIKQRLTESTPLGALSHLSWIFPLSVIIILVFMLIAFKIIRERNIIAKKALILGAISFIIVLVFELIGAMTYGYDIYVWAVAVEEGFEMIGVSFFLTASLLRLYDGKELQRVKTKK